MPIYFIKEMLFLLCIKKNQIKSILLLIEKIHFDLSYTPLKHLGYKSVIVNLSDIYSMNALPSQIILNIAISNKFSVEAIDEFYDGVKFACEEHNIDLIKSADHIIDLGPHGGDNGGQVVFTGTPEELVKEKKSLLSKFLKPKLSSK